MGLGEETIAEVPFKSGWKLTKWNGTTKWQANWFDGFFVKGGELGKSIILAHLLHYLLLYNISKYLHKPQLRKEVYVQ